MMQEAFKLSRILFLNVIFFFTLNFEMSFIVEGFR